MLLVCEHFYASEFMKSSPRAGSLLFITPHYYCLGWLMTRLNLTFVLNQFLKIHSKLRIFNCCICNDYILSLAKFAFNWAVVY